MYNQSSKSSHAEAVSVSICINSSLRLEACRRRPEHSFDIGSEAGCQKKASPPKLTGDRGEEVLQ